jgi:hypothetical protein
MNEQTAAKQIAEADDAMNRLLRGQPSVEQEAAKDKLREKTKRRLEDIAADEDDPENAAWARGVLEGKTDIAGEPITSKPKPAKADGGEGRDSPARTRSAADQFNASIRAAYRPWDVEPWWIQ